MKERIQQQVASFWRWAKAFFWRREALYGAGLIILLVLLVLQLSLIPTGSSPTEVAYVNDTRTISAIGENSLSLPHKGVSYLFLQVSESVRAVRAVSILFFGVCSVALYRILKRWHSDKIALFSAALFASNATVLAVGRLGAPHVLLFGWAVVISLIMWLRHGRSRKVAPFAIICISAGLLYVPGAPYFFILLFALFSKKILRILGVLKRPVLIASAFGAVIVLLPLILSMVRDINVLKMWLLLPDTIVWSNVPQDILRVPSAFIYRAPADPLINVGRLPILDVASGGLFLVGLYAYQRHIKLERTKIMLLTALLSIIIGALGQVTAAIIILLPFVYAVISAGIAFILDQWYSVFPKNPFARSFGLLLITGVILASMYYQLTRFFVVWPQTPETRAEYNQSRLVE